MYTFFKLSIAGRNFLVVANNHSLRRSFSTKNSFFSKNTVSSAKDVASLLNPINLLTTMPYSSIKLSHNGEINPSPTMLGQNISSARDIRKLRGTAISGLLKLMMLPEAQRKKSTYNANAERFLARGQLQIEADRGQTPPLDIDFNLALHTSGAKIQAISTTTMTSVARLFACNTATPQALYHLAKGHPTLPQVVIFDLQLLSDKFVIAGGDSDYVWEDEVAITTAIPHTAKLGARFFVGPFGISRFIFNELYIDIDKANPRFLNAYEEFHKDFEKFMKENYDPKSRGVILTYKTEKELIDMYVEIFKQYKNSISYEQYERLNISRDKIYITDVIVKYLKNLYPKEQITLQNSMTLK